MKKHTPGKCGVEAPTLGRGHDVSTQSDERSSRRRFLNLTATVGTGLIMPSLAFGTPDAQAQAASAQRKAAGKVLIAYVTRTNNTKVVAEIIQHATGATLMEIDTVSPYPENYAAIVAQVQKENETGYLPPLKAAVTDPRDYDTVFLGFPTWGMQLPPPMKSLLRAHDLSAQTVVPFNTNAGYGAGSSFQSVKALCPGARLLQGFSTKGGVERDGILLAIKGQRRAAVQAEVMNWLKSNGIRTAA